MHLNYIYNFYSFGLQSFKQTDQRNVMHICQSYINKTAQILSDCVLNAQYHIYIFIIDNYELFGSHISTELNTTIYLF